MTGHVDQCVDKYLELAELRIDQLHPVSTPCMDAHYFDETDLQTKGTLAKVCSRIVLKILYTARMGRPDCLWTVNSLAREVTKWTAACDKRLHRLMCYLHHTREYSQAAWIGDYPENTSLALFCDASFAGDLKDSRSTSAAYLVLIGPRTFVPISWFCKKQTAVAHSSTESEIIALDAGLRLDGIPALSFWEIVIDVLSTSPKVTPFNPPGDISSQPTQSSTYTRKDLKTLDTPTSAQPAYYSIIAQVLLFEAMRPRRNIP